jgi:hypothetical protein
VGGGEKIASQVSVGKLEEKKLHEISECMCKDNIKTHLREIVWKDGK